MNKPNNITLNTRYPYITINCVVSHGAYTGVVTYVGEYGFTIKDCNGKQISISTNRKNCPPRTILIHHLSGNSN